MEHNALKYASPLQRSFSRSLGLDENAEGVTRLGETLTPIVDAWDITNRPEHAYLRSERLCSAAITIAPGVGFLSRWFFRNPLLSVNVLAIIDSIVVASDTTGRVLLVGNTTNAGSPIGATAPGFNDQRWGQLLRPQCGINIDNTSAAVPAGTALAIKLVLLQTNVEMLDTPMVLPPDQGSVGQNGVIALYHGTVTTPTLHVTCRWRERVLMSTEYR